MSDEIDKAEEFRRLAEKEREEHELRRRIAEGGPDQHVPGDIASPPGRYEMEQERQAAEEVRKRTARITYARFATLIALPLAFIALIPSAIGLVRTNQIVADQCQIGADNCVGLRIALASEAPKLGLAYDLSTHKLIPVGRPIIYYREHPDEADDLRRRIDAALAQYPTTDC